MSLNGAYNIIRHIGKGSFSEVYLCEEKDNVTDTNETFLIESQSEIKSIFIIKEINIENLVKKYINKTQIAYTDTNTNKIVKKITDDNTIDVNITPYKTSTQIPESIERKYNEQKYYRKRLINLIESEIEILQRISHENIIKFYSSIVENSLYSIKMEYCEYGDLYTILKTENNFTDVNDRNYFKGICNKPLQLCIIHITKAIKYLHNLHIIHRDIKLQNILIKKTGSDFVFKLADFGFACFDLECSLNDSLNVSDADFSSNSIKKKYYKLCGTPYYMAPEIILNLNKFERLYESKNIQTKFYDKNVDMWSFGMSLYELIFNSLPYSNISDMNDLKEVFSNKETQLSLSKTVNNANIITDILKDLLNALLVINSQKRINVFTLHKIVESLNEKEFKTVIFNTEILDLENLTEIPKELRKDIITEPLSESWEIEDAKVKNSWDKINRASSLIMKMSIDKSFMKWMFKKN